MHWLNKCDYERKKSLFKTLHPILIGIGGLIVLILVVSIFLPRKVLVERSLEMNTAPDMVFTQVNDFNNWALWSSWTQVDSETKWVSSENPIDKDAWYTWDSESERVGKGKLTITESVENQSIETELDFDEGWLSLAEFKFEKTNTATKVTWNLNADMENNPIGQFLDLMMDKWVGADDEKGLAKLKEVVEKS